MTARELANELETFLADQLGEYSWSGGFKRPAVNVGTPAADVSVSGLEVIIDVDPEYANVPLNAHTAIIRELPVRFIPHDGAEAMVAIERVMARWLTSSPSTIPADERLGIGKQYELRVRSS